MKRRNFFVVLAAMAAAPAVAAKVLARPPLRSRPYSATPYIVDEYPWLNREYDRKTGRWKR